MCPVGSRELCSWSISTLQERNHTGHLNISAGCPCLHTLWWGDQKYQHQEMRHRKTFHARQNHPTRKANTVKPDYCWIIYDHIVKKSLRDLPVHVSRSGESFKKEPRESSLPCECASDDELNKERSNGINSGEQPLNHTAVNIFTGTVTYSLLLDPSTGPSSICMLQLF